MPLNKPYLLYFDNIGTPEEGYITTTQNAETIPFLIKRVFWTYDTPESVVRGQHANKQTEEVLIAVKGTIHVKVNTGEGEETVFILNAPDKGLYLPSMHWTKINFTAGAIMLTLASSDFVEEDYIRDYEIFLQEVRKVK